MHHIQTIFSQVVNVISGCVACKKIVLFFYRWLETINRLAFDKISGYIIAVN